MKAISFNINSIRSRPHQLQAIIDTYNPDFIGLQETKVADEQFPQEVVEAMGYHVAFHGQKSHYGVALMSRHPFIDTIKGFPCDTDALSAAGLMCPAWVPCWCITAIFHKVKAATTRLSFRLSKSTTPT